MSDNLRRYRARREALTHYSPGQPSGAVARPLSPLAALSSGLVGSTRTPRPHIAAQGPNGTPPPVASNAWRGGATTPTSWRRCPFCPRPRCGCVLAPCPRWGSAWMAAAGAAGVPRCCSMWSRKVAPCRWPGGCAKPRRGPVLQLALSPESNASAGCSQRERGGWCWALGQALGRGSSTPCSRRAGPPRVARPRAPWRRGRPSHMLKRLIERWCGDHD